MWFFIWISGAGFLVFFIGGHIGAAEANTSDEWHLNHFKRSMKLMAIPIALIVTSIFVPSSRTVYLIAASEVGERVVQNEKVQGLFDPSIDILKNYITLENEKIQKELKNFREKK